MKLASRSISFSWAACRIRPGFGFRHSHVIRVVVVADADGVHGKSVDKKTVDLFDHFLFGYPSRDIGLVRYANQHVAGLPERFAALVDSRGNFQLRKIRGRVRLSVPHNGAVENTVPIQEDRAPFSYRTGAPSLDNTS